MPEQVILLPRHICRLIFMCHYLSLVATFPPNRSQLRTELILLEIEESELYAKLRQVRERIATIKLKVEIWVGGLIDDRPDGVMSGRECEDALQLSN